MSTIGDDRKRTIEHCPRTVCDGDTRGTRVVSAATLGHSKSLRRSWKLRQRCQRRREDAEASRIEERRWGLRPEIQKSEDKGEDAD